MQPARYKYLSNFTKIQYRFLAFGLIMSILFFSCSNHHKMEKLSKEIINTDRSDINNVFYKNIRHTKYFLDSVIKNKPDKYFGNFLTQKRNFKPVFFRKHLFIKQFYHNLDSGGHHIMIEFYDNKSFGRAYFYYANDNNNWLLKDIVIRNDFDIEK